MRNQTFKNFGARIRGIPLWAWEVSLCATMTLPLLQAVATFQPPFSA
jgi:hypothetical protein